MILRGEEEIVCVRCGDGDMLRGRLAEDFGRRRFVIRCYRCRPPMSEAGSAAFQNVSRTDEISAGERGQKSTAKSTTSR